MANISRFRPTQQICLPPARQNCRLRRHSSVNTETATPRIKVGMISLGCAKNLVDSEIMLGSLLAQGIEITNEPENADVVIVNTCSFIDSAQEESVDTILESDAFRKGRNAKQGLIVSGCLPQRFKDELPKLLPEVDAFIGIDQVKDIPAIVREALVHRQNRLAEKKQRTKPKGRKQVAAAISNLDAEISPRQHETDEAIRGTGEFGNTRKIITPNDPNVAINSRPKYIPDVSTPRFRLTPKHFAYLKIAEGCNHPCSFCIIPRMRGSHRSRQQSDLAAEAKHLVKDGVRELNLISQDSTYYGLDLRANHSRAIASPERFTAAAKSLPADATTLSTLLRELNSLRGSFWIRMLYTHPAHWTDELIETIRDCRKVARYVDIPLQHIHDTMLQKMRRETSREYIMDLIRRIRKGVPGIALRTTFIVGFPGETDAHFESLLEFIRETRFERLGIFTYSQEDKTIAGKMARQVPDELRQERRALAMAEQHDVAKSVAAGFVGRTIKVLVEDTATHDQLQQANISSWEHGLIREKDGTSNQLKGNYLIARGEADAPDIDGRVYIKQSAKKAREEPSLIPGNFAKVRIVGHTDYDLIAESV